MRNPLLKLLSLFIFAVLGVTGCRAFNDEAALQAEGASLVGGSDSAPEAPPVAPVPDPSPTVLPPSEPPPDQTPPGPVVHPLDPNLPLHEVSRSCRGALSDDFPLAGIRVTFYTGRKENAGINQAVYLAPLGKDSSHGGFQILSYSDSNAAGNTEEGSVDFKQMMFTEQAGFTAKDFSKTKVSLPAQVPQGVDDRWFLGGLIIQGLKKGCDAAVAGNWTNLYFNPVVRTWITPERALIVSQDDAIAIFAAYVGDKDDAGSDDTIHIATPFETKSVPNYSIEETPSLNHADTDDFERNRTYYYGRSYFAESQGWAVEKNSRLLGSFNDLSAQDWAQGFRLYNHDGEDGVYFSRFLAYLIRPIHMTGEAAPLRGRVATRNDFWLDPPDCGIWACVTHDEEAVQVSTADIVQIPHFGSSMNDNSPLGILTWLAGYDDPARAHTVTGGI